MTMKLNLEITPFAVVPMAIALIGGAVLLSDQKRKGPKATTSEEIELFGFMPVGPFPDSSPACIKLATYLKICKVPFKHFSFIEHNFTDCPRNKVPWIRTALLNDGKPVSDSTFIMQKLMARDPTRFLNLDSHLTPEEKAIGTAFKVMCEESLYWTATVSVRWRSVEQHKNVTIPTYFSNVPRMFLPFVNFMVTRKMRRDARGQGLMFYSDEEVVSKASAELEALSVYLGDKKCFMGDKITSFDATVFAYLAPCFQGDWDHPILDKAKSYHNLDRYVHRMLREFFPELQEP